MTELDQPDSAGAGESIANKFDQTAASNATQITNTGSTIANQAHTINYNANVTYNLTSQVELREEENNILKWLEATDTNYNSIQNDYFALRQPRTGEWLLGSPQYQTWFSSSEKAVLFCPGIPGGGKTILTSIVVDQLTNLYIDNSEIGVAYIYFNFKRTKEQQVNHIFLSILRQFAQKQRPLPASVKDLYHRYRGIGRPSRSEIVSTLHSVAASYSKSYIIVDALDECQSDNECRSIILEEIFHIYDKFNINVFATSRFMPDIEKSFEKNVRIEIRASNEDVQRYLDSKIDRSGKEVLKNNKEMIKTKITELVNGMFLLAHLHFESIKGKPTVKMITRILKSLAAAGTGDAAYDRAYDDAMARINGIDDNDSRGLVYRTLGWISCASRPLTTSELKHALGVELEGVNLDGVKPEASIDLDDDEYSEDEDDEEDMKELDKDNIPELKDMVSLCAGLVAVDEESDIIRLVHYTTQQYFEKHENSWFPHAHRDIAITCVVYMSYDVFETGKSRDETNFKQRLESNSLYYYATQNWGYHVLTSSNKSDSAKIGTLVLGFLKKDAQRQAFLQAMFVNVSMLRWDTYPIYSSPGRMLGLHVAAHLGLPLSIVKSLAGKGVDLEATDDHYNQTPLSWAAKSGHVKVVRFLLSRRAKLETRSKYGQTPLSWAAKNGHTEVLRVLIEKGAKIETKDDNDKTPLAWAAENGHLEAVKLLVENGADIESQDETYGHTPLAWAAKNRHADVIKLLAEKGADLETKNEHGETPLLWAALNGGLEAVKLLFEMGADVEAKDESWEFNSLQWAAKFGRVEVVRFLLSEAGANIETGKESGYTPLAIAAAGGHNEVVEILLDNGADIEAKDAYNRTPFWTAVTSGREETAQLLAQKGAEINSIDLNEQTPLLWAIENDKPDMVEILKTLNNSAKEPAVQVRS